MEIDKQEIEEMFLDWINGDASLYSFLIEYFYGDVEIEDPALRREMMYKWLKAAYQEGFEAGCWYNTASQEVQC